MRSGPVLALALAAAVAGLLPGTPARADDAPLDTVRLKNGKVVKGRVSDRGPYVIVEHPGGIGAVQIERAEIQSIEMASRPAAGPKELDIVVLTSGQEIAGEVEIRDSGRTIVVKRVSGAAAGGGGEMTLDHRSVRQIVWSKQATEAQQRGAPEGVGATVEKLVDALGSEDEVVRRRAREDLYRLGVFALPYLEARVPTASPALRAVLEEVLASARVKTYLSPALAEKLPGIERRLIDGDAGARLAAAQELVMAGPRECVPAVVFLVERERDGRVRAFLIGQLAKLGRNEELVELLDRTKDGSLKLAAAVALGDNGVYIGVPVVIEALRIDDASVRKLAIDRLEAWTGQFLGFFADDAPAKRAEAVTRWEEWWAKDGKAFADASVRATVRRHEIGEDEKTEGIAYWKAANEVWEQAIAKHLEGEARRDHLERAWLYLRKSIDKYPALVTARISLAVLLYVELGQPDEAKRELDLVLTRYADDGSRLSREEAHYHLARIAHLRKEWGTAEKHYRLAAPAPGRGHAFEAHLGLGRCLYDRAVQDDALAAERRKELLEAALERLAAASAAVDAYELDLDGSTKEGAAEELAALRPYKSGGFLKSIEQGKAELRRTAGEIHYLRGRTFAALKRDEEARKAYTAALELDPGNALYKGALAAWSEK